MVKHSESGQNPYPEGTPSGFAGSPAPRMVRGPEPYVVQGIPPLGLQISGSGQNPSLPWEGVDHDRSGVYPILRVHWARCLFITKGAKESRAVDQTKAKQRTTFFWNGANHARNGHGVLDTGSRN